MAEVEVLRMTRTQIQSPPQTVASWSDVGQFIRSELSAVVSRIDRSSIRLLVIGIAVGILLTVAIIIPVYTQLFTNVGGPLNP
jgi:hypothetical protein